MVELLRLLLVGDRLLILLLLPSLVKLQDLDFFDFRSAVGLDLLGVGLYACPCLARVRHLEDDLLRAGDREAWSLGSTSGPSTASDRHASCFALPSRSWCSFRVFEGHGIEGGLPAVRVGNRQEWVVRRE